MIIKLEFDVFQTTIKISNMDIPIDTLRHRCYNELYPWLRDNKYKSGGVFCYDDDAVLKWFREVVFKGKKIEVLEKHTCDSEYQPDAVLFF